MASFFRPSLSSRAQFLRRCKSTQMRWASVAETLENRCLLSSVSWSPGPSLPTPLGGVSGGIASNGAIIVAGAGSSTPLQFAVGAWASATPLDWPVTSPGLVETGSGLLVFGGTSGTGSTNRAEIYDQNVSDNTYPVASMSTPRSLLAYAADGGTAYAIGGLNGTVRLASVESYNPVSSAWTPLASLPVTLSGASAVDDGAGHILVLGGTTDSAAANTSVYRYTVATNSWDTLAHMPLATTEAGAALGSDGLIYVAGGRDVSGAAQATVQAFDESTDTWSIATALPSAVRDEAVVSDAFGRLEVIGGYNAAGQAVNTVTESQVLNQPDAAPAITSTPVTQIPASGVYSYQVTATANPQPVYSFAPDPTTGMPIAPAGMTIDPKTGIISWTPMASQAGTQNVVVQASNRDGQAMQSFSITLAIPSFTTTSLNPATANVAYSFQVQSSANPTATYSLLSGPGGMTISPTGLITWTPGTTAVGNNNVTIQLANSIGTASQSFTVGVKGFAPTGVTAAGSSTSSVQVSWSAVSDSATYNIYRVTAVHSPRGSGVTYYYTLVGSGITGTSYNVTGLSQSSISSSYEFVVTSVDTQTGLQSAYSTPAYAQTWYPPDLWGYTMDQSIWGNPVTITADHSVTIAMQCYSSPAPTYSVTSNSQDLIVDPNTGVSVFTPTNSDVGTITAVYTATTPIGSSNLTVIFDVSADLRVTPTMAWPAPAAITLGTPFDVTQMNATATDPNTGLPAAGTITYTAVVPNSNTSITLINPTWLGAGIWNMTATFTPTDPNAYYTASINQTLTVYTATSTTNLTATSAVSPPGTSVSGEPVTLTAHVTQASGFSPTGSVDFMDGTTDLGSAYLDVNANATLTTGEMAVGTHTITAVYAGDSNTVGSTSNSITQVVSVGSTTTTLAAAPSRSVYGQPVTLTATVSGAAPSSGIPTGTVTFMDGSTTLGTGTIDSTGTATLNTSALGVGLHSITAAYGGDTNYAGSSAAAVNQSVAADGTITAVTASPSPSVYSQAVTFTATVSAAAPGSGVPAGTVTFEDGTTKLGTGILSNGVATFTTSTLSVGTHRITAVYGGSTAFTASTAPTFSHVISKEAATATVSSSSDPSVYGQSVTLTATLLPVSPGTAVPTGSVTFKDGSTTLATVTLSGGVASFKTAALAVGTHSITVVYSGNSNISSATSVALSQVVNKAASTVTLTASPNPGTFGQTVTFTATVGAVAPGAATPTGTVKFMDGSTLLGTVTVGSGGAAKFSIRTLARGLHQVTAVYSGDMHLLVNTSLLLLLQIN